MKKVNKNRAFILDSLKQKQAPLSGEALSKQLKISRVAVWKHIKALIEEGYSIESLPSGYKLKSKPLPLSNMEFSCDENTLIYQSLETTMKTTSDFLLSQKYKGEDIFIVAAQQTKGIGQYSSFDSPKGGLYLSIGSTEKRELFEVQHLKKIGNILIKKSLEELSYSHLTANKEGIFYKNIKIGGALEEYYIRGGLSLFYSLGLGINLANLNRISHKKSTPLEVLQLIKKLWIKDKSKLFEQVKENQNEESIN